MSKVFFTLQSRKDLEKLPIDIQKRIIKKLEYFTSQPQPLLFSKPLVDLPPATHRFRVGHYRITFYIEVQTVVITRIRHRKEVYST